MLNTYKRWLIAGIFPVLLISCATSPTGRTQLLLVSPEIAIQEAQLVYSGMVDQAARSNSLLADAALVERVGTITGKLVTRAVERWPHTASWNWSVMLIDAPDVPNAFCAAGGLMGIYSGLVSGLDLNDDELAQVMGHEIGHAIANHSAEKMSVASLQQTAALVVAIETEDQGLVDLTNLLSQLGVGLPNSRTAEYEADEIGMELAVLAGYAADAGEAVWRKFAELPGDRPLEFLSTHPSEENRRERLSILADQYRDRAPSAPTEPYSVEVHWDSGID